MFAVFNLIAFLSLVSYGIEAVALGYLLAASLVLPSVIYLFRPLLGFELRGLLPVILRPLLATVIIAGLYLLAAYCLQPYSPFFRLIPIVLCGLVYVLLVQKLSPQFVQLLRRALPGKKVALPV